ncbi:MAG: metallophosphoesterase family protein [Spirochaetes bacterium]|nr:metallophosphoesterase family protein [Spirochaetota bacterium]
MNIIKSRYSILEDITTVAILADPGCRAGWEKNFPPILDHVWKTHRPGAFLVAGDMSLNSHPEEYETIIGMTAPYPAVIAAVPGDHDRPVKNFMKYFGTTRKVVDIGEWRFIMANTSDRMFLKKEADFIEGNLRERNVILSHVPPEAEGWTFHSLWPRSSDRFLALIDAHRDRIRAAFFGHIHGHSVRERSGVPLIATGGIAESKIVRGNRYDGDGRLQMMVFDIPTGEISLCEMP